MYEDPEDRSSEGPTDPAARAAEKVNEFRMHAELAAVFEGVRKFDAQLLTNLDAAIDVQRAIGKLEKAKLPEVPIIAEASMPAAAELLAYATAHNLSTNDYHLHRRPGEVMIARWLEGEQVETFYDRMQKHLDAALNHFREEEKTALEWKQDDDAKAYLTALDQAKLNMADRYLRPLVRENSIFVLSTQTADEMNILHLSDYLMSVPVADLVGRRSAPPDDPKDSDLAWFFKLFSLRGMNGEKEQLFLFVFMQKSDDSFSDD